MKANAIQQYLDGAKLDTASKILIAALFEFGNAPVKDVGTRDIAKRAGVNIAAISYYFKGKDELYSELVWVVLPVASFDAYFGDTSFSKKYLPKIPPEIMERSSAFGISRYRITEEYLP